MNAFLVLTTTIMLLANIFGAKDSQDVGHSIINVVILGDSNSSIGGDNCDNPRGWTKWFPYEFKPRQRVASRTSGKYLLY